MSGSEKRFKIALSFPGEKREFVERVADCLAERIGRDRVLYDKYYEAEFAVLDLDTLLQDLYRNDSELIAIFLCAEYENKRWCQLEWRAIKNLITERTSDIMPLRFDNTEIPGIFPSDGYIWIGEREPEEIAERILRRAGYKPEPSPTPKPTDAANQTARINTDKLPQGTEHLIGRDAELAMLDAAWNDPHAAIVELVAPGGTGKTALVKEWLVRMRAEQWRGAQRVYGWSFYSQGSDEKRQASEDGFLADALKWFDVDIDPSAVAADKGSKLAEAVAETRALLVLDGMEPLQYPPGAMGGRLKAPGVDALLYRLASAGQAGLCLVTTREALRDLEEYTRTEDRPSGGLLKYDLDNLSESDGARLLHTLGVTRAGAAEIEAGDQELIDATREVKGHALTLNLLGRYLKLAYDGDIRHYKEVGFQEADAELDGGHAFRVMAAYQTWFERAGEQGARQLAALRLLGFFDRPADRDNLAALRAEPPIPGLTEPLMGLSEPQWKITLGQLAECGLILRGEDASLDAHPLVRENLARRLRDEQPLTWREGHRRLYEQLKNSAPYRPDDLPGLQPLYRAVAHGALAGMHQQACDKIFRDRILRGSNYMGNYSTNQLGAVGEDLAAVAALFDQPWERPAQSLTAPAQAWLIGQAAFYLLALGRSGEAAAPMRVSAEIHDAREQWSNGASGFDNLSVLQLNLGELGAAVTSARRALEHAERSEDLFQRLGTRASLADALQQKGETEAARALFAEAEEIQSEWQPSYPQLYSCQGFQYCDLLLAVAERGAWLNDPTCYRPELIENCVDVEARATQTLRWAEDANAGMLSIALEHLSLARCALYRARLQGTIAGGKHIEAAVKKLRASGYTNYLPLGLLTRAWFHHASGDETGAAADLDEAWRIASRGGMKLYMADIHLYRARLFRKPEYLAPARKLIEECGYGRRLPELEDAEKELGVARP